MYLSAKVHNKKYYLEMELWLSFCLIWPFAFGDWCYSPSLPMLCWVPQQESTKGKMVGTFSGEKGQDGSGYLVLGRTWSQIAQKWLLNQKERWVQWVAELGLCWAATSEFGLHSGGENLLPVSLSASPSWAEVIVFHFTPNLGVT